MKQAEHEIRVEQAREMQRTAIEGKKELCRPVVIGDVVEELNNRTASYLKFGLPSIEDAMDQALRDFSRFTHAAVIPNNNRVKGEENYFVYNA